VALGDWSTWMKWKREESKKHKAKEDMYLVSFCLCGLCLRRSFGLLPLLAWNPRGNASTNHLPSLGQDSLSH